MMTEFKEILGETKRKQWYEVIAHQSKKVKHHSKEIRAKAQQIAPKSAISSYESKMLHIQRITAKAQRRLVDLESKIQDMKSQEGKALVSSKALEFKDKVRTLASHIKLVETRDDPEF